MSGYLRRQASTFPVLVASRIAVRVAWGRLPDEIRREVKVRKGPKNRGTYLDPLGPAGLAWVHDAIRRFGVRRWVPRRGWIVIEHGLGSGDRG